MSEADRRGDPNDWSPRGGWEHDCAYCGKPITAGESGWAGVGHPMGASYAHVGCFDQRHPSDPARVEIRNTGRDHPVTVIRIDEARSEMEETESAPGESVRVP